MRLPITPHVRPLREIPGIVHVFSGGLLLRYCASVELILYSGMRKIRGAQIPYGHTSLFTTTIEGQLCERFFFCWLPFPFTAPELYRDQARGGSGRR
jgi:hypothetical protein